MLALCSLLSALCFSAIALGATDEQATEFIRQHEENIRPLEIGLGLAWWNANVSGKDADFAAKEEAQNKLDAQLSNKERFAILNNIHDSPPSNATLGREIEILYLIYLEKQVEPELLQSITAKANSIEKRFNVYRAKVGSESLTDSEVRKVLLKVERFGPAQSRLGRQQAGGAEVEAELKELVLLRNEAAKRLGFPNYHVLQLRISSIALRKWSRSLMNSIN